jgi:hypothetical protein
MCQRARPHRLWLNSLHLTLNIDVAYYRP